MLGNDRLYLAVVALATDTGDVRSRVVVAMNLIASLNKNEFQHNSELWKRIMKLKEETSKEGPQIINERFLKDAYANTAASKNNSTYKKFAIELFNIWIETCK